MRAIVAVDENWNIGSNGDLLVHLSGDLQFFKEQTTGKTVVMGRKTYESLKNQKPLPNRKNIVLTKNPQGFLAKYAQQIASCPSATVMAVANEDQMFRAIEDEVQSDVFVIGGGQVYRDMLPYCKEVVVTKIMKEYQADTSFPNLDKESNWRIVEKSEIQLENGIAYMWNVYKRMG